MWETLNMALLCCPVGFSEVIIAVFQLKKSQIDTKNDETPKNFPIFKAFSAFFSKFQNLDRVRQLNVEKDQKGENEEFTAVC